MGINLNKIINTKSIKKNKMKINKMTYKVVRILSSEGVWYPSFYYPYGDPSPGLPRQLTIMSKDSIMNLPTINEVKLKKSKL